jgi:hypothetical protein
MLQQSGTTRRTVDSDHNTSPKIQVLNAGEQIEGDSMRA